MLKRNLKTCTVIGFRLISGNNSEKSPMIALTYFCLRLMSQKNPITNTAATPKKRINHSWNSFTCPSQKYNAAKATRPIWCQSRKDNRPIYWAPCLVLFYLICFLFQSPIFLSCKQRSQIQPK